MLCPACFEKKPVIDVCPACGFDEGGEREARFLPYRTALKGGRYTVGIILGKAGGFGVAYKAMDTQVGAVVVVKECLLTESQQVFRDAGEPRIRVNENFEHDYRKWLVRFRREARLISRCESPYIVRVTDVFEDNNTAYYAMPFVEGEDLAAYCRARGGRLPEAEVARFALSLLWALAELQAKRIVHRDIKPSNILITVNKRKPVLIDFGAAREQLETDQSHSIMAMHTVAYAPLEQVTFMKNQGPWTDIYSLCATLYFCLVGKPPPEALKRGGISGDGLDPYVPIRVYLPDIDDRLATVIDEGLVVKPGQRLQGAAQAIDILEPTTGGVPEPPPPGAPGPAAVSPARPLPAWAGFLPAAAVLAYSGVAGGSFANEVAGWPGLVVIGNVFGWGLWLAKRSKPPGTGKPPKTGSAGVTAPTGPSGTTGPTVPPPPDKVVGIEIQLRSAGFEPITRRLRPGESITIGRTDRARLVVPNPLLSALHASVSVSTGGEFTLEDRDSTNHTYIAQPGRSEDADASWREISSAAGRKGRFMLGPPGGEGVRLDIRPVAMEP